MALQSIIKSGGTKRLILLAGAPPEAALAAIPASNVALAQTPPGEGVTLVNEGENFIERKDDGRFIACPLFDREIDVLYYGVRDPDTGQWLAGMYRVQGERRSAETAGSTHCHRRRPAENVTEDDADGGASRKRRHGHQMAILYLFYGFFVLYVIVQMVLRPPVGMTSECRNARTEM